MFIRQNLRCHYFQNTITNGEKIFDINNIDYPIDIIVASRGGVSAPIGNYEYLHILPQPSGATTLGWQRFVIAYWR